MQKLALTLILAGSTLCAQRVTDTKTAELRGSNSGGEGKCTLEVEVDGVAEVEISGGRAQIRTLSGSPSSFRRFECNQQMPLNPNDFRFKGIDGRGRQELVRTTGRGVAVVRIEDTQSGREGYTFDIFWRGGSGTGSGTFGNGDSGVFGDDDRNRRNGDFGNGNTGVFGNRNGNGNGNGNGNNGRFGNGNRNSNGNNGPFGNNNSNWNRELNYRGRGDGFIRMGSGSNDRLYNCRVAISRGGDIQVTFDSERSNVITLNGRVQRMDQDLIYADMNGSNLGGIMEIVTDGRNRVRNIQMRETTGRNRYELSWHE